MSQTPGAITHVSDTALMVAACRAAETEHPEGFVRDPFAARLAGERGVAMLQAQPQPRMMQFGIGVRTRLLDDLLLETLASQTIATVLSLGCGLDTRPWRLDLPPDLRWIEADFADMLDYKEAILATETPRCLRERLATDVNDAPQRHNIYAVTGPAPALMITEGLLMYLPAASADALASEAWQESGIAYWICDIRTAAFAKAIQMDTTSLRNVQASDSAEGEQLLDCIYRHGWITGALKSYITDAGFALERSRRMFSNSAAPPGPPPALLADPTGVHRFQHVQIRVAGSPGKPPLKPVRLW